MPADIKDSGKAVIEDGAIVIRVHISALQTVMDGGFASAAYDKRWKVRNPDLFAKEIVTELNAEDHDGSTAVHRLFDKGIIDAIEQGAQWVEEHSEQTF